MWVVHTHGKKSSPFLKSQKSGGGDALGEEGAKGKGQLGWEGERGGMVGKRAARAKELSISCKQQTVHRGYGSAHLLLRG